MHIDVTNVFGRRIYVDDEDRRGRALARTSGDFNPLATALWRVVLGLQQEWDFVLDIGANYGEMLAGADLSSAHRIIAFEPNGAVAARLRSTLAELPWAVDLREQAVGAAKGTASFVVDSNWSGKSHVASGSERDGVTVDVTTVDSVLAGTSVSTLAVKIDVEGLELDVLEGMRQTIDRADVVIVMLEILHMSVQQVSVLTRTTPMYLLTTDGAALVRLPTDDPMQTGVILHDGSTHRENAVMVLGSGAGPFIERHSSLQQRARPAPTEEAKQLRERLRSRERELRLARKVLGRRSVKFVTAAADRLGSMVRAGQRRE